jgi:hypothetical protein
MKAWLLFLAAMLAGGAGSAQTDTSQHGDWTFVRTTFAGELSCSASTYAFSPPDGGMLSVRYEPLLGGERFAHVGEEGSRQLYLTFWGVDYPPSPMPELSFTAPVLFQHGQERLPDLLFGGIISAEGRNHNLALRLPDRVVRYLKKYNEFGLIRTDRPPLVFSLRGSTEAIDKVLACAEQAPSG